MHEYIGYVAAFCTTAAYFPQALKVFKTRKTKDISIWMFLLMTTGLAGWLVYGLMISAYPIIFANTITLILAIYILIMKIRLEKNSSEVSKIET
jgi:MtN3 and saliva related transmembrane protein